MLIGNIFILVMTLRPNIPPLWVVNVKPRDTYHAMLTLHDNFVCGVAYF